MSSRWVASSAHARISAVTCALMAFILGRSNRIVPIAPSTSSRTSSPTTNLLRNGRADPTLRCVFRDSRGVVHTVSAADPLDDVPAPAADALARTLLVPSHGDLG